MELGGFEPPTSWVRSKELCVLETADLQGVTELHWNSLECQIPLDSGRFRWIEPLVGLEWLKCSSRLPP